MEKNRAIPEGCRTVGQVAKQMGVTVRTLQYYDRKGLLPPSLESEGGRRLYTDQDVIRLHQILSMKALGFSLDDIKNRLIPLNTPADVAAALSEQAAALREKMAALSESLRAIEALKEEVLQMQTVDFRKYADIVVNLQMNNKFYWLIKHFDDETLERFHKRFDQDSGPRMMETFQRLQREAVRLLQAGSPPTGEEGQVLAKAYWDMVLEFTGGDMSMLPQLMEVERVDSPDPTWKDQQQALHAFLEPALEAYFDRMGFDPFKGETE